MILWWLLACRCAPDGPPPAPEAGHFGAFSEVVAGAVAADRSRAVAGARDLLASAEVMDDPEAVALGGAVGFVLTADDDELVDGAVAVARACAGCHTAREVEPPSAPPVTHRRAADHVAWALVWSRPVRGPGPQALDAVWTEGPAAVWGSCAGCHPAGRGLP